MPDKALENHVRALGDIPEQPDTYRGWSVHRGRWPEPAFMATGPNYDAWTEGEGEWTDNGEKADGATWEAVCAEIDAWITENCEICDGEGNIWKHADPTTGQRCDCYCLDKTGVPA